MRSLRSLLFLPPILALAACATAPIAPGVLALPGSGKSLDEFQVDDAACRQHASGRVGASPGDGSYEAQRQYDFAYIQCMYARGHKVPVSGGYTAPPAGNPPPPSAVPPAPEKPPDNA